MTRRQQRGFVTGDFDPAFPLDEDVMKLRASLDPLHYYAAVGVWFHVVAAAWRRAERVPASATCPDAPDVVAELLRVGLLDRTGRMRAKSFDRHVGKAIASRAGSTERKRRQRSSSTPDDQPAHARMSRVGHAGQSVTDRDPREGREGQDGTDSGTTDSAFSDGGVQGGSPDRDPDPADAYWTLTGRYPTDKTLAWIDQLTREYGPLPVIRAVAGAHGSDRSASTLLGRAQDLLRREARALDLASQRAEQERIAAVRAAPRPEPDRAAINAVLAQLLGGHPDAAA